ncbi:HAD family hydrolase [Pseudoflavonifractor capillosus]|uniref:Cof-type HAD-IIB family hydrolase n=1 Tax=Pseudoflavonifractor capillosus TaxID=106588 RepID=A0A921MPS0_9FIRM|nr:HAD family hydrolase [Pseudoflavonifractor capillosus]HJG87814.1 Cof-type HAD-IIB family hydrolase [Pseudoflavonifractor capillosus]
MEISLLAMDLDGTALLEDHKTFTPRLYAALSAAARKGVAIVPATGRQYAMLPPAVHTGADWENLCVLCNGGEVRRLHTGELLEVHYIEAETAGQIVEIAARMGLSVELSAGGLLYLTRESWDMQREHEDVLCFHLNNILTTRGRTVSALEEVLNQPELALDKVNLPYIPEALRAEVEALLKNAPVSFAWSSPHSVEITHSQATKANGMLTACRILGVDPACTMAIGDSGNDIPMLRAAALGVAMGNATREVKDAADAVTASNMEDGAAIAIERYILGCSRPL